MVSEGGKPEITENDIYGNGTASIEVTDSKTAPVIRSNNIHHGTGMGICFQKSAKGEATGNWIFENEGAAIDISLAADPLIRDNDIRRHEHAIRQHDGAKGRIKKNNITT